MLKQQYIRVLNYLTLAIWMYAIFISWGYLNSDNWAYKHLAVVVSLILCLQVLAHSDLKKIIHFQDREALYLIITFIITIVCMILSHSVMGGFLIIFNFCLIWYLSDRWVWSAGQIKAMLCFFILLFFRWVIFPEFQNYNTNSIGLIALLLAFGIIAGMELFYSDKKWNLPIQLLLLLASALQIIRFKGRGSLIALIVYLVFRFAIPKGWWRKPKFTMVINICGIVGSLLFVAFYTYVSTTTLLSRGSIFSKATFSGRESIWMELWHLFKVHPVIGTGNRIRLKSIDNLNVHNSLYNILVVYGVIVFILVVSYLFWKLQLLYRVHANEEILCIIMSSMIAIFFESYFETTLLWSETILMWMFLILILASAPMCRPKAHDTGKE